MSNVSLASLNDERKLVFTCLARCSGGPRWHSPERFSVVAGAADFGH